MRIAIVEDDKKDMEQLVDVIKAYAAGHEISLELDTFASGEDFLRAFAPQKYKLIFFDNYIGSGLGIDLARKARELDNDVEFVFVSMSMEFALSGYEVRALHYLIKPATFGEIEKIFERLWRNTSKPQESMVEVVCDYHPVLIPASSIRYVEVVDKACIIHAAEDIKTYMRLGSLMELLPKNDFIRPHRRFAVALDCIQSMNRNEFLLKDGERVPIGQSYHNECKRAYIEYRAHSKR